MGQSHRLAVLALAHAGDLHAAAGLAGTAVGGRGVENDQAAVLAHAQADPHMAVHAEHVAGVEVLRAVDGLGPGAEAPVLGEVLGHAGGGHHIALAAGLGVHSVVHRPGHVGRAVHAREVVLVPAIVGVVAVGRVAVVAVGVVRILALEEINPSLGDTDGGGLVGRGHVLPVPAAAVDIEGGAHRLHGRGQEVLQGGLARRIGDRGLIVLGHEGLVDCGLGAVVVDFHRLAFGQVAGLSLGDLGSAGLGRDGVDGGVRIQGDGLSVHGDGVLRNRADGALDLHVGGLGGGYHAVLHGDVKHIALGEHILDGVVFLLAGGDGEVHLGSVHAEAVHEALLLVLGDRAVTLHAQVHRLVFRVAGILTLNVAVRVFRRRGRYGQCSHGEHKRQCQTG